MKLLTKIIILFLFTTLVGCEEKSMSVRGWIILSDDIENAITTIKTAKQYDINHIQLSHELVHNLMEVKNESVCANVNRLTDLAHQEGISEVFVWDHSFYNLKYYPDEFKTGSGGMLDLDNPAFWEWFKNDYREMLDLVPDIDGLILTFIETGAHAEKQFSVKMKTNAEKLAAVVNAVSDVVVNERKKKLYIRTFAYSLEEYDNILGCLSHLNSNEVVLMMKETPHDFFLTHPNDPYVGKINRPTIVEFDTGNEFSGQGVIANTWVEYVMKRWKDFISRPNVTGYVARTDRYGTTKSVGTPNEILLYTLKRTTENPNISVDQVYDEYIVSRYGKEPSTYIKSAFTKAYDIVTSSLYTLGTNVSNHSAMDFEPYKSSYGRHVSGRWIDPPVVYVQHGINKEFHYWKDIVNHISPKQFKEEASLSRTELGDIISHKWLEPVELMDSAYLNYIITEKRFGMNLAAEALSEIEKTKDLLNPSDYDQLYQLFKRTYLTAQLYEAVSTAYFGYRVYSRGENYRYKELGAQIESAFQRIDKITDEMKAMEGTYAIGQWDWLKDAETALHYKDNLSNSYNNAN